MNNGKLIVFVFLVDSVRVNHYRKQSCSRAQEPAKGLSGYTAKRTFSWSSCEDINKNQACFVLRMN